LNQVDTFSLKELRLLMRYASPMERVWILLALDCGFGRAEVSSLLVGEVFLHQAHHPTHQEMLAFKSTVDDSFIKRVRRKSGVYGEHILFPLTVQAVEWSLEQRRKFPGFSPEARLLVNGKG